MLCADCTSLQVPVMKLVEVIKGLQTCDEAFDVTSCTVAYTVQHSTLYTQYNIIATQHHTLQLQSHTAAELYMCTAQHSTAWHSYIHSTAQLQHSTVTYTKLRTHSCSTAQHCTAKLRTHSYIHTLDMCHLLTGCGNAGCVRVCGQAQWQGGCAVCRQSWVISATKCSAMV